MALNLSSHQPIAVVKVGGDVLLDKAEREGLALNLKQMSDLGWSLVLLHGGGPQINQLQQQQGLTVNKVAGRRITSAKDLKVVKQAVAGEVNVDLTALLIAHGLPAFGCHGASGCLISAVKRPPTLVAGANNTPIDFGAVGDVTGINSELLTGLLKLGQMPVIATLGVDEAGRIYNINADTTVVQIAAALKADLLLLTTGIGGIFKDLSDPSSRIKQINQTQAKILIEQSVIQDGMIVKVEEAFSLLKQGVGSIAIVGGKTPGTFVSVALGKGEAGTRIVL